MIFSMLLAASLGNTPMQSHATDPAAVLGPQAAVRTSLAGAHERARVARIPQVPLRRIPPRGAKPAAAPADAPPPDKAAAAAGNVVVQPAGKAGVLDQDLRKSKAKFSFDFSKAEILDVVKAISDMTKMNFIVPEKIKGQRISILSPTHITAEEAYQVFYTALASNGISLVRVGKFYKLVDSKDSFKDTIPTCIDDDPTCMLGHEQMVTLLLHLHHADAGQINAVAKTLMSKDGDVLVYAPSNALIISEYGPNLKRLRRIIETLDVPGGDDDLQLLQIQYSAASELAEKVTQIFEVSNKPAPQGGPRPMPLPGLPSGSSASDLTEISISKIVADDRTNQLIIKANRRSFAAVRNLIAKLDVPISEAEQGKVHVYYLENAKAEDLASTLSSLATGTPGGTQKNRPGAPGGPATPPPAPGGKSGEAASLFEGEVKITSDKATNSLLVMSSAHDYRAVRNIIEKLDMPRRQVYVEAAIMEISLDDSEQIGMQWHAPISHDNFSALSPDALGFIQSSQSGDKPSPTFGALYNVAGLLSAAGGSLAGLFGPPKAITLGDNSPFSIPTFGLLLKWLQTNANTNILSAPHLLTTDNEQAKIEVGNKIPFNTGAFGAASSALSSLSGSTGSTGSSGLGALSALGGLGAVGGLGSVQRIDVSLKLTLTPQINERGKIRLEIDQTVEDVSNTDAKSQSPSTSHRSIKTVVVVDDQQTIVLGGLIRDRSSETETKIPFLGDLPLLGYLFKTHSIQAQKVNLLLVLTPYIISSQSDFQRIFERKMAESDEFAAQYFGHRKEYRAYIDYTKKTGPLSRMVATLRREREKYENGGDGDGSSTVVQPKRAPQLHLPVPQKPADGSDGGDDSAPVVPGGASRDSPASPDASVESDSGDLSEQPDAAGKGTRVPPAESFKPAPAVEPDDSFEHTPDKTEAIIPEDRKAP